MLLTIRKNQLKFLSHIMRKSGLEYSQDILKSSEETKIKNEKRKQNLTELMILNKRIAD